MAVKATRKTKKSINGKPTRAASKQQQQQKESEEEPIVPDSADDSDDDDVPNTTASDSDSEASSSSGYYDSEANESESESDNDDDDDNDESDNGFEDQGSSDEEEDILHNQIREAREEENNDSSDEELEVIDDFESIPRNWKDAKAGGKRGPSGKPKQDSPTNTQPAAVVDPAATALIHTDDLSSDDEDPNAINNRIGRIPLHWYDEYEHIGYDPHGTKVAKKPSLDRLAQAIQNQEDLAAGRFVVEDTLNAKDVTLTDRQIELIRRIQAGSYAHPEHDANPDMVPYYSGVDPFQSGMNSNRDLPKARFQPSKYEKRQVRQLLHRLEKGDISIEYLRGEVKDMNDVKKRKDGTPGENGEQTFRLWRGDEEDELHNRKGPQHIAAPKVPPPSHAASYNPPDEYLPTQEEIDQWEDMDVSDRPHGLLVPKKFTNLRSVGAYAHAVRERFERCLDLYLCPRVMKRRLNIDPETLVPRLPDANDLRPFPTTRCIRYDTPYEGDEPPMIRCLTMSPDGQFFASGATDGFVRLWELQTGRLIVSWDVSKLVEKGKPARATDNDDDDDDGKDDKTPSTTGPKPIVSLEWNPNPHHHCLLAAAGRSAVVIATGTGGPEDAELTDALLSTATTCTSKKQYVRNEKAAEVVRWESLTKSSESSSSSESTYSDSGGTPISAFGGMIGPVVALHTTQEMSSAKWHRKGDYFVTVSPKAASAAVLIHQLNRANSQRPFGKGGKGSSKAGEVTDACFHPSKPFLFVCARQQIRIYHLVKQTMVKKLISGCRWISSLDVHVSGDHVIAGSLDRRMVWFDLDLSSTPYKTLKYHEKALRHVAFHPRYPLMASSSDDGTVHVFHSMVYSDLMRNPLIVPVKILKGQHQIVKKLGVLSFAFHPTQPWLLSGGADGKICLYQDI